MSARTLPLLTLALGIATLIAFIALGSHPGMSDVYARSEISSAVSTFQRAETPADIAAVFGSPPDARRIAAMDALNRLDLWAFVPAYLLFLSAAAVMLGGLRNRWTQLAMLFAVIGATADAVETWKQLQLTADIANVEAHLPIAPWHWIKYFALALNGVAVASLCITAPNRRWILAVIALAPILFVAAAYVELLSTRAFAGAFTIYWIALLVLAAIQSVRGKDASA